jgi:hypothetical protein
VARVIKEILPEKENVKLGCPSKLSSLDKRRIVSSITTGKADNAVQATHLINPVLSSSISAQTVCNVLKAASLKAVVKKKKAGLCSQVQGLDCGGLDKSYLVR